MTQPPVPNPPNPVPQSVGNAYNPYNSYWLIREAMRNAGYLDSLDDPTSDDLAEYLPRLNLLVNYEQTQGLKLWLQEDVSFTPVQGVQLYSLGLNGTVTMARPTRVIEAYFILPTNLTGGIQVMYPLIPLSRQEWDNLGVRNASGITNSYYIDKQQQNINVWLWLNPDAYSAQATVHLICQVQATTMVSVTDVLNFPVEWGQYLHWALADEISVGQPNAVVLKCAAMRKFYQEQLEAFDVEDASTLFQTDPRQGYHYGRFA